MVKEIKIAGGFQQTDVGVIPNDWEIENLSEIAHFENGKAHEQFIDEQGDFVVVNSKFISTEGRVRKHCIKNIFPLKKGDITIVMSDIPKGKALAKCFLIDKANKYTLNQRIGGITANEDTDNKYLFYKLNRNKYYLAFDSGTGQTNIKRQEILDCPVVLPPTKAEQTAISTALSDMDGLIKGLGKLLVKKRNIKQGAMKELLTGRKRIDEFGKNKEFQDTEVGIIPSDWDIVRIGDIFQFKNGLNKEKQFFGKGTPIVNYMDVFNHSSIRANNLKGKVTLSSAEIRNYDVRKGDVFFTRTSETVEEIGISTVVLEGLDNTVFSGFVLRGRPINSLINIEYCQYCFSSTMVRKQILTTASFTTRALTNGRLLSNIKIPIPSLNQEQTAIATALSDMDTEIEQLETQLSKYKMLKTGMMQELLTGKKRLI